MMNRKGFTELFSPYFGSSTSSFLGKGWLVREGLVLVCWFEGNKGGSLAMAFVEVAKRGRVSVSP